MILSQTACYVMTSNNVHFVNMGLDCQQIDWAAYHVQLRWWDAFIVKNYQVVLCVNLNSTSLIWTVMGYFNVEPVEKVVELVQQVLYVKAVSKGII